MKARKNTLEIIAALLILLWAYAALSKWGDHKAFYRQLYAPYILRPHALLLFYIIPSIELLAVGLIIWKRSRMIGFALSSLLMMAFTGYILYILTSSSKLPCSCGGILSSMHWKEHLYFNILFLILALTALTLSWIDRKKQRQTQPEGVIDTLNLGEAENL